MAAWSQILQIVGNSTLFYLSFDTNDSLWSVFIWKSKFTIEFGNLVKIWIKSPCVSTMLKYNELPGSSLYAILMQFLMQLAYAQPSQWGEIFYTWAFSFYETAAFVFTRYFLLFINHSTVAALKLRLRMTVITNNSWKCRFVINMLKYVCFFERNFNLFWPNSNDATVFIERHIIAQYHIKYLFVSGDNVIWVIQGCWSSK